jgi:hypothetical protein
MSFQTSAWSPVGRLKVLRARRAPPSQAPGGLPVVVAAQMDFSRNAVRSESTRCAERETIHFPCAFSLDNGHFVTPYIPCLGCGNGTGQLAAGGSRKAEIPRRSQPRVEPTHRHYRPHLRRRRCPARHNVRAVPASVFGNPKAARRRTSQVVHRAEATQEVGLDSCHARASGCARVCRTSRLTTLRACSCARPHRNSRATATKPLGQRGTARASGAREREASSPRFRRFMRR